MLKEKFGSAFSFLQASSPPLIGVDISSSALKLVELSETGKGAYRLERYAVEPLAKDVIAEAAGLKPRVMDVESYATEEAFQMIAPSLPANGRDQNIALVDIGAHVMHFYVLRNNQILFSRDQAFGGNQLTHEIQRAFNLSPEEAESAKKNAGLPENYDGDVLQPFMETLALEITRGRQFFFTSTSYSQVDQVVLAGGCALLPCLHELVAKRARVHTIFGNPFASMTASDRIRPRQLAAAAPLL